jgi:hypothetical protein
VPGLNIAALCTRQGLDVRFSTLCRRGASRYVAVPGVMGLIIWFRMEHCDTKSHGSMQLSHGIKEQVGFDGSYLLIFCFE